MWDGSVGIRGWRGGCGCAAGVGGEGGPVCKEKRRERFGCMNKSLCLNSGKDKREAKWNKT